MYIKELILEDRAVSVSGDLYIDCTGFRGVLIDDICKRPWESVEHILPTNNAIAIIIGFITILVLTLLMWFISCKSKVAAIIFLIVSSISLYCIITNIYKKEDK